MMPGTWQCLPGRNAPSVRSTLIPRYWLSPASVLSMPGAALAWSPRCSGCWWTPMAKIAVLGYRLSGVRSGAHRTHLELAGFLAARGHNVIYAALSGGDRTRFGDQVRVGSN